jgi:hypothetical protein
MEIPEAIDAVQSAVIEALGQDGDLLVNDAHEQTFTHRLAVYLERHVPDWHVNVEYDLDGTNIKTLPPDPGFPLSALEGNDGRIKPDIVVHTRDQRDNQIVIEVKKLKNKAIMKDVWKLSHPQNSRKCRGNVNGP